MAAFVVVPKGQEMILEALADHFGGRVGAGVVVGLSEPSHQLLFFVALRFLGLPCPQVHLVSIQVGVAQVLLPVLEEPVELLDDERVLPNWNPAFGLLLGVLGRIMDFLDCLPCFSALLGIVVEVGDGALPPSAETGTVHHLRGLLGVDNRRIAAFGSGNWLHGEASLRRMLLRRAWRCIEKWRIPMIVVEAACSFLGRVFRVFGVDRRIDLP